MSSRSTFIILLAAFIVCAFAAVPAHAQSADLLVTKDGPTSAAAGADVPYTVTVNNLGPDPAANVTLTDSIPAGMSFVSAAQNSGPAFSCSLPNPGDTVGAISCTAQTMLAMETATFTFTFNIPPDVATGQFFTNIASVSTITDDPNEENNSASATTAGPAEPSADLGISKSAPSSTGPDTDVTYTIFVTNGGPDPAVTVSLDDTLPGTMTFVSITQNSGPAFNCTTPAVGSGGTITCTIGVLASGTSATFTLVGHIPPGTPSGTTFQNTATIDSMTSDPNAENDTGSAPTVVSVADLIVTKTKTVPGTAVSGTTYTYSISATNGGANPAESVTLSDPLPAGTTFVSMVQNNGPAFNCVGPAQGTNGTVVCDIPLLAVSAIANFTLTVAVPPGTAGGIVLSNTATITASGTYDPNTANNSSTDNTNTVVQSDLSASKSGPATIIAGNDITYTIGVANAGPSDSSTVTLTDSTPANTTFVSLVSPGWSCTTPAVGGTGTITCTTPSMLTGTNASFTLVLHASPSAPFASTISNIATFSAASDPNNANNSATSNATVQTSADLITTKTGATTVVAGNSITYTIGVSNAGPSEAQTVTLSDTTPPNTTFTSLAAPAGWSCITPPAGGTGPITCSTPVLANGAAASFTLTLAVPSATASGTLISNNASVISTTSDPNGANNGQNVTTTVSTSADLSVVKTGPANALNSAVVAYTITATNAGPSNALTVTLSDPIPAGTTFASFAQNTGAPFNCTTPAVGGTGTVNCTIASFPSAATATFTLSITTGSQPASVATNTVTIGSTTPDPNNANNTSTVVTAVAAPSTDVAITKTATPNALLPNSAETFTITVTNNGPAVALGTTVTDVLPTTVTLTSASSTQGSCSGTTTVTCSVGTLASGASATITLRVQTGATTGPTSNTATVTIANVDTNPANNTSTTSFDIVAPIPVMSPLALLLMSIALAAGGAIALKARG
jgi:uncharacterized repeat protein (TIGR01451 family)